MKDEFEKATYESAVKTEATKASIDYIDGEPNYQDGYVDGARWAREWCEENLVCDEYKYCTAQAMINTEQLRTENQRLREALEKAREAFKDYDIWDSITDGGGEERCFVSEALKETGGDDG